MAQAKRVVSVKEEMTDETSESKASPHNVGGVDPVSARGGLDRLQERISPVTVRLPSEVEIWTGDMKEDLYVDFILFKARLHSSFGAEGVLEAIQSKVPVKVGDTGADVEELKRRHTPAVVEKSFKAWRMLLASIRHMPVLTQIMADGSPSGGWDIFCRFYEPCARAEKNRLAREYYGIRMMEDETPLSYFQRFTTVRSKLALHGVEISDSQASRHLVDNLSPEFDSAFLCTMEDLTMAQVERGMWGLYGELEFDKEEGRTGNASAAVSGQHGGYRKNGWGGNNGEGQYRRPCETTKSHPRMSYDLDNNGHRGDGWNGTGQQNMGGSGAGALGFAPSQTTRPTHPPTSHAQPQRRRQQPATHARTPSPRVEEPPSPKGDMLLMARFVSPGEFDVSSVQMTQGNGEPLSCNITVADGKERWWAYNSAMMVTGREEHMFDITSPPPGKEYVSLGGPSVMRVQSVGSLKLLFHTDGFSGESTFGVLMRKVYFVPGVCFNMFSLNQAAHVCGSYQFGSAGIELFDGRLTFLSGSSLSRLWATRVPRSSRAVGFTAI